MNLDLILHRPSSGQRWGRREGSSKHERRVGNPTGRLVTPSDKLERSSRPEEKVRQCLFTASNEGGLGIERPAVMCIHPPHTPGNQAPSY